MADHPQAQCSRAARAADEDGEEADERIHDGRLSYITFTQALSCQMQPNAG